MKPNKLTPGYNLRWESSRMMLPEHKIALIERKRQQGLAKKPLLDEQALSILNNTICEAMAKNRTLRFQYFHRGKFLFMTGNIGYYDETYRQLRIRDEQGEVQILDLEDIIQVE